MLLLVKKMQTALLFIFINKLLICVDADPQVIRVKPQKLKYIKPQNYEFVNKVYDGVLPGQPLQIIFEDYYFPRVRCSTYTRPMNIIFYDFRPRLISHSRPGSIIDIENVTDDMSDIWQCIVYENINSQKYIYFEIIVKDAKPEQMILVNNNILRTRKHQVGKYIAEYIYEDSEEVDLVCVSSKTNNCSVKMYKSNKEAVSLRADSTYRYNLKGEDIREMVCTCDSTNYYNKTTLVTKFMLQDNNEDVLKLTINGRKVKSIRERYKNKYYSNINYAYFSRDILKVECKIENDDYKLSYNYNTKSAVSAKWTNDTLHLNITPSNILQIKLSAQDTLSSMYEETMISFKQINAYGDQKAEFIWIALLIVIIVIIVLVCVTTTIYKMKKRNCLVLRKREAVAAITLGADQGQTDFSFSQVQLNPREHIYDEPENQESVTFGSTLEYDYVYNHLM